MARVFGLCQFCCSFLQKCLFRVSLTVQASSSEAGEEGIMEACRERREWERENIRTSHCPLGALQFLIYFPLPLGSREFLLTVFVTYLHATVSIKAGVILQPRLLITATSRQTLCNGDFSLSLGWSFWRDPIVLAFAPCFFGLFPLIVSSKTIRQPVHIRDQYSSSLH